MMTRFNLALWGLILILSSPAIAQNEQPVVVTDTGIFFIGEDCDYHHHEIGPLTDQMLGYGDYQFLQIRFPVMVRCFSRHSGYPYVLRQVDVLIWHLADYEPRQRAWYAPDGTAVAWFKFETNLIELNPNLEFKIWSNHADSHMTYAIEVVRR